MKLACTTLAFLLLVGGCGSDEEMPVSSSTPSLVDASGTLDAADGAMPTRPDTGAADTPAEAAPADATVERAPDVFEDAPAAVDAASPTDAPDAGDTSSPTDATVADAVVVDARSDASDAWVPRLGTVTTSLTFSLPDGGATNANTSPLDTSGSITEGRYGLDRPAYQIVVGSASRSLTLVLREDIAPGAVFKADDSSGLAHTVTADYVENQKSQWYEPWLQNPRLGSVRVVSVTGNVTVLAVEGLVLYATGANGSTGTVILDGTLTATF